LFNLEYFITGSLQTSCVSSGFGFPSFLFLALLKKWVTESHYSQVACCSENMSRLFRWL
jgi:hypothetical protein